jgi:preprotein translocase subunit YajC
MLDALFGNLLIWAEDAPAEGGQGGVGGLMGGPMFLLIGFVLLFYFLLMRPQSKERAKRTAMIQALKPNDRVLTVGGIYGVVFNVNREADSVTLRIDDSNNTKMRVSLGAISRVIVDVPAKGDAAK